MQPRRRPTTSTTGRFELRGQVGGVEIVAKRHAEAAHAFDHHRVRRGGDFGVGGNDRHRLDRDAFDARRRCAARPAARSM